MDHGMSKEVPGAPKAEVGNPAERTRGQGERRRNVRRWRAAAAEPRQSCPTLRDPMDGSPTGSSVPGILQARVLEWAAVAFSKALV